MSGKRLGAFRAGDRSEYLAAFGLSRLAFVDPVPRQEDFGIVDFLCVLARDANRRVYPERAFYVQVKSNHDELRLDQDSIHWITHHMDHPLVICVSEKSDGCLTFYSCSHLWLALFLRPEPTTVTLRLNSTHPDRYTLDETAGSATFEVFLGHPILRCNLSELEADPANAFAVLEAWIRIDADNIARRRLGRIAVRCFWEWQTNVIPEENFFDRYYFGPNYQVAERAMVPMLTALGHNYLHVRDRGKLQAVRGLLNAFKELLDEHSSKIADGTEPGFKIDD